MTLTEPKQLTIKYFKEILEGYFDKDGVLSVCVGCYETPIVGMGYYDSQYKYDDKKGLWLVTSTPDGFDRRKHNCQTFEEYGVQHGDGVAHVGEILRTMETFENVNEDYPTRLLDKFEVKDLCSYRTFDKKAFYDWYLPKEVKGSFFEDDWKVENINEDWDTAFYKNELVFYDVYHAASALEDDVVCFRPDLIYDYYNELATKYNCESLTRTARIKAGDWSVIPELKDWELRSYGVVK